MGKTIASYIILYILGSVQENNFKKGKEILMEGARERDEYHLSNTELILNI